VSWYEDQNRRHAKVKFINYSVTNASHNYAIYKLNKPKILFNPSIYPILYSHEQEISKFKTLKRWSRKLRLNSMITNRDARVSKINML
jgi:hypothetical protein